jgi:hypothetical protein
MNVNGADPYVTPILEDTEMTSFAAADLGSPPVGFVWVSSVVKLDSLNASAPCWAQDMTWSTNMSFSPKVD